MITYSSVGVVPFIWEHDPAIDKNHPAYNREAFERTGDMAHLPLVEGCQARVFKVRRLGRKAFFRVMGMAITDQVQEAVAYGLVSMEPSDLEMTRKGGDFGERLSEVSLDRLFDLGPNVMIALGTFIIGLGKPDPT